MRRPSIVACLATALVALIALVGSGAASALGAAPAPGPTPAHPYQGLRRLTVATVPPVPGMPFTVDGRLFAADAQGIATTLITKAQREAVRADRNSHLRVVEPVFEASPGVRARFTGWSGAGTYRKGNPVPEEVQRATFDMDYLTSFRFTTVGGDLVPARSLTSMRLLSSLGDLVRLDPAQPKWLQGSRTATGGRGLQSRAVSYRVQSVGTAGVNVVNRGQQQFFPSRQHEVFVSLLFFNVRFSARDALLGSSTGSSFVLEYPNGHSKSFPLHDDRPTTVRDLPRGTYHVTIRGAGPEVSQKLTVSKDQQADFDTVTWLDVALGVALVLAIAIGLVVLRRIVRKRARPVPIEIAPGRTAQSEELIGAP
jgi:hypothetical protein